MIMSIEKNRKCLKGTWNTSFFSNSREKTKYIKNRVDIQKESSPVRQNVK